MSAAGIICEYNPFHSGHMWQIAEIRRRLGGAAPIVCAMSGNFVQRGDFALVRKHSRAAAAVKGGADLVLELPTPWATASAEGFGRGGAAVLCATGVVDTICFGSECGDTEKILRVARTLGQGDFSDEIRKKLAHATSFAAARQDAVAALLGTDAAIMSSPNDILAISYAQATLALPKHMSLLALPRKGAQHDGAAADGFASASFLREKLISGENVSAYLPSEMAALYARESADGRAPVQGKACDRAMLACLRRMSEEEMACYDEGNEGLYHRVFDFSRKAATVDRLLASVKTKRYAYAGLRRMILRMYLGILPEETKKELPYLRVLACNARGRELLKEMKKTALLPILTKSANVRRLSREAQELFALEARATDLYTLAYPDVTQSVGGSEWTTDPAIL